MLLEVFLVIGMIAFVVFIYTAIADTVNKECEVDAIKEIVKELKEYNRSEDTIETLSNELADQINKNLEAQKQIEEVQLYAKFLERECDKVKEQANSKREYTERLEQENSKLYNELDLIKSALLESNLRNKLTEDKKSKN